MLSKLSSKKLNEWIAYFELKEEYSNDNSNSNDAQIKLQKAKEAAKRGYF